MIEEKLVELLVNEDSNNGIDIISFVEDPAHESEFMHFSKQKLKFSVCPLL